MPNPDNTNSPTLDKVRARIHALESELEDRTLLNKMVDACGGWQAYITDCIKKEGELAGLKQALALQTPDDPTSAPTSIPSMQSIPSIPQGSASE